MIYVTGDTHGTIDFNKVKQFCLNHKELTKDDYIIICGDCGVLWDKYDVMNPRSLYAHLQKLKPTFLFCDGNHENFSLLNEYSVEDWNGGKVHKIAKNIIHLMRGYVFTLEDKKFFVMGGGHSVDKEWRREGVSWWAEEMPSDEEYQRGLDNLALVCDEVDFIITHTAPMEVCKIINGHKPYFAGEEKLQNYFSEIAEKIKFDNWYFGHWHTDNTFKNFHALYQKVLEV